MNFTIRISDSFVEIESPEPLSLEELKKIFTALEKQGIVVRSDYLAGDGQPLDSKLIKGRLCG
ncbi:MAG: hypothetical protein QW728_06070 [Thermoplasmata archaeon]